MPKRKPARVYSANPKVREIRLRELASRWGLRLTRSRQRDGLIAGSYGLSLLETGKWVFAGPQGWGKSIDEVETFLQTSQLPINR